MARRRRLPKGKTYLKPKPLAPEQAEALRQMPARKRSLEIEKLPDGVIIPPRIARAGAPERHRIGILPDGSLIKTYLEMVAPGKFKPGRTEKFPDANKAMRKATHTIENLGSEIRREEAAQAAVDAIHKAIYENWENWNPAQRQTAKAYILGIIDGLYKRTPKSKTLDVERYHEIRRYGLTQEKKKGREKKRLAVERLNGAIKLLNENNKGAACARLVGASNALIKQISIIRDQRASTLVDREIYKRRRVVGDTDLVAATSNLEQVLRNLENPRIPSTAIAKQLKRTVNRITGLQGRYAPFRNAIKPLLRAIKLAEAGGGRAEIKREIDRALNIVFIRGSESTRYSTKTLKRIKELRGEGMFIAVTKNQLRLFAQNAKYWYEKASARQRESMHYWLRGFHSLLIGTIAEPLRMEIKMAEGTLGTYPKKTKEILLQVVEKIDSLLKKASTGKKK